MDPRFQMLRVLWGAFAVAHVVLAIVGPVFGEPDPDGVGAVFLVSAVMPVVLLLASGRILAKAHAQTLWLVRYAACEAVGMNGLAAHMAGAPVWVGAALSVAGLLAHLTTWPTDERITRWEVDRLGADDRQQ